MNPQSLALALQIWMFLAFPGILFFCVVCGYYGLIKSVTITHFGIKSGTIARIYGFFYLLTAIGLIFPYRFFYQSMTSMTIEEAVTALLDPFRMPNFIGITFIGMGLLMFIFVGIAIRFGSRRKLSNDQRIAFEEKEKVAIFEIGLIIIIGIFSLTNIPSILPLGLLLSQMYYSSFRELFKLKSTEAG